MANKGLVLYKPNDIRLEETKLPEIKPDEVLLQMEVVGICGSDVHYYTDGKIGPFEVKSPMILGHEGSGTVLEVGCDVTNLEVGDRVAVEPGISCRRCEYCKKGEYNLCPDMQFCATPPIDGLLQYKYKHAADFCHKLPDSMDFEDGALLEPLSCAVHACQRGRIKCGQNVCIFGAGPIGLCCLMVSRALGAKKIMISDTRPDRLERARNLGADMVLEVQKTTPVECYMNQILKNLGEAHCCLEAAGQDTCMQVALKVTARGGAVVLMAVGSAQSNISLENIIVREVDLMGIFRYRNAYPVAMEFVRSGIICMKDIVTHRFEFDESIKAFDTAKSGEGNPIKILISCKPNGQASQQKSCECFNIKVQGPKC